MAVHTINFAARDLKLDDVDGRDHSVMGMVDGSFEAPLPIMVMACLSRLGGTFVDVGANSGIYSVLAGLVSDKIKVEAFDPFPEAVAAFDRNIGLNGVGDRVRLHRVALSSEAGSMKLYIPDQGHGLFESSCSLEREFKPKISGELDVEVLRLDDMDGFDDVSVMKVDIEGHEYAFFEGAMDTLTRNQPIVFFEVLGNANFARLNSIKHALGYRHFRLTPQYAISDDAVSYDRNGWNHAFVPPSKYGVFCEVCRTHQLEMVRKMEVA